MSTGVLQSVTRFVAPADPRADPHLIDAFLTHADQDAFAELVRRHGPAVLAACRRALGPTPDAEDAFQATFLVLVRRTPGTHWRGPLGPWLYGVALRVARKARAARARRLANEKQVPAMPDTVQPPPPDPDDAAGAVDEELAALPVIYRRALVLCEIQGATRRDAARELGLSEGTLSSRLARGRRMLRARLAKRGVVPAAAGLAVPVPRALATATVRNATHVLTHTAGAVPAGVLFLTEGAVKTMITKWKLAAVVIATCIGLTGLGAWQGSAQSAPTPPANRPPAAPPDAGPVPRVKIVAIVGEDRVITDQEVMEAVYQAFQEKKQAAQLAALDGPGRAAKKKELYAQILRKTIDRELIIGEMHVRLKKANKMNVIDEIAEFAAQSADRHMRALRIDSGAKSDEALATMLWAQGRSIQVIRRQMQHQRMSEQYASSLLKETGTTYEKLVEELWRKGMVRVFER